MNDKKMVLTFLAGEFEWWRTPDGKLWRAARKVYPSLGSELTRGQIILSYVVTFLLALVLAIEVAAMTGFILFTFGGV